MPRLYHPYFEPAYPTPGDEHLVDLAISEALAMLWEAYAAGEWDRTSERRREEAKVPAAFHAIQKEVTTVFVRLALSVQQLNEWISCEIESLADSSTWVLTGAQRQAVQAKLTALGYRLVAEAEEDWPFRITSAVIGRFDKRFKDEVGYSIEQVLVDTFDCYASIIVERSLRPRLKEVYFKEIPILVLNEAVRWRWLQRITLTGLAEPPILENHFETTLLGRHRVSYGFIHWFRGVLGERADYWWNRASDGTATSHMPQGELVNERASNGPKRRGRPSTVRTDPRAVQWLEDYVRTLGSKAKVERNTKVSVAAIDDALDPAKGVSEETWNRLFAAKLTDWDTVIGSPVGRSTPRR